MSYDISKLMILGKYKLDNTLGLETVVMKTTGMRIDSLLYVNDINSIGSDKKKLIKEIKNELYSDMFDHDSIKIKVREAISGEDAICKVRDFIEKNWDEDTITYFYNPDPECYEYLDKLLADSNVDIFMEDYINIFVDSHENIFTDDQNINNDIITIMQANNLKVENLIKDNKISMAYFLSGLIEKLFSK